ncbi:hypothetical protein OPHB3_0675 [Oceanobacillus picturae]|uniref:Uncharacterized protein n=1 Tax=Oceanobacillus picturae TaxID=171693 RepID=A0A0U9H2T3_9BACI|nr:hypothetical protein OPHB3_0675 [Oceanobacillus picturae]
MFNPQISSLQECSFYLDNVSYSKSDSLEWQFAQVNRLFLVEEIV